MSKKTINQALTDLFIGLGGKTSELADNTSVSDYIADLESAIKGSSGDSAIYDANGKSIDSYIAGGVLTGTDLNLFDGNTEPVSRIDLSNIVLPPVTAEDNGKILAVVNGAWTLCTLSAEADLTTGAVTFAFNPD